MERFGSISMEHSGETLHPTKGALPQTRLNVGQVSPRVSPKTWVSDGVFHGVLPGLRAPSSGVSKKCPESVPRLSNRWTLRNPGPEGLWGHAVGHSVSGPKGPGDPVAGRWDRSILETNRQNFTAFSTVSCKMARPYKVSRPLRARNAKT